jgi:2-polyprenyl-6-methoxyphenol hydroxylase-like FAD-dependent oxidoreductase
VVGAGIGGLAAAIALRRGGWEVTVFERADELRPLGAGLSIWPNGVRALRALGLGDLAERAPRGGGALRRADGSVLAEFDPDAIAERYGAPLIGLHRADLHNALADAAGRERLRLGAEVVALAGDELRFADGSTARAELIVGADGIESKLRAAIVADGAPRDSGIVAFRGLAEFDGEVPAGEWWGEASVAGLLPLLGGRVYWYFAFRGEPDRSELHRRLEGYGAPVGQIVGATAPSDALVHRLYDRRPSSGWSSGPATLLGDAAHPMLPFLGQGACAALEDAVGLAAALERNPEVEDALPAYELARYERTKGLVENSARAARVALIFGARLRNILVAHTPVSMRLRQLDRVVGRP